VHLQALVDFFRFIRVDLDLLVLGELELVEEFVDVVEVGFELVLV